jgi:hypothetical protein
VPYLLDKSLIVNMRTAAAVLTFALAQLAAAQSSAYGQVRLLPCNQKN